mgnify:FL=1
MNINCFEDGTMVLDWEPEKYKTKAGAAKGLYKALRKWCEEIGYDPDTEVRIDNPEENKARGYSKCWSVGFEAGPYEWAISASGTMPNCQWGFCEPYYSFNLQFVE